MTVKDRSDDQIDWMDKSSASWFGCRNEKEIPCGEPSREFPQPDPEIVPIVSGSLSASGHPELTCLRGRFQFQGYTVWLTRPGQQRRIVAFPNTRGCVVNEPLPKSGNVEVWTFEVQYRYQNKPFGQISRPLNLTVKGVGMTLPNDKSRIHK